MDGSGELRILLCRPKPAGERGSSILAACGIYVRDILDAVPIDKYFELFKPGEGSEGGFIRISMNYLLPDQVRNVDGLLNGGASKKSRYAGKWRQRGGKGRQHATDSQQRAAVHPPAAGASVAPWLAWMAC